MNPDPTSLPPLESMETDRRAAAGPSSAATPTLDSVLGELRRLAILALDAGHPLAAAQIATTADRVEAEARQDLPPRPNYAGRR